MTPPQVDPTKLATTAQSPRNSSAPLLDGTVTDADTTRDTLEASEADKKRRLFGRFGKKKEGEKDSKDYGAMSAAIVGSTPAPLPSMRPVSPLEPMSRDPSAPAASPSRRIRSSSPNMQSPASSSIFERNVQENTVPSELSPAIPTHIQTEDHIPPVLEASSLAITDDHLGPDEVEIVMHTAHQPAAAGVSGGADSELLGSPLSDSQSAHPPIFGDESAPNYGSVDPNDVRRLSFISFADVVMSEHAGAAEHLTSQSMHSVRSPSPMRSPVSSHGMGTSPPTSGPTSGAASMQGVDAMSAKSPQLQGSIPLHNTHSPTTGGEIMVETMRQALRKTGSGDLSSARSPSQPLSPVSMEDSDRPPFR